MNGPRLGLIAGAAALFVLVTVAASVANGAGQTTAAAQKSPREIYLASCSPCHGESGDGKGITVLERPARSFKDGGFSYGNTPEALLRTITHGIPGALMPSFRDALKEDDRKALAAYVLSLGPPTLKVEAQDTVMVVSDRAVVARGKLPPIVDGAPERPRGLLIGLPSGLTFEYRTDDVRLLGVRSGEFADRTDWVGRGGTFLQPLGQLVRAAPNGEPAPLFSTLDASGTPTALRARLLTTAVSGPHATITYDLLGADGNVAASVHETPLALTSGIGVGWTRAFVLQWRTELKRLRVLLEFDAPILESHRFHPFITYLSESAKHPGTFDLTLIRDAREALERPQETERSGRLDLLRQSQDAAWTLYVLPTVTLPRDADERRRALVALGKTLP